MPPKRTQVKIIQQDSIYGHACVSHLFVSQPHVGLSTTTI